MAVYLVRHGVAVSRSDWGKPDLDDGRPLTKRGRRQADGLVELLGRGDVRRLESSPTLRCLDTVRPLARTLGLDVEPIDELREGVDSDVAAAVVRKAAAKKGDSVLCTHGDVVPEILRRLAADGLRLPNEQRWAKGSTWVLGWDGERFTDARYLPPQA
ncbi:MAG: SixA phosphatase family protein [Acidimicrobiales bacterium]